MTDALELLADARLPKDYPVIRAFTLLRVHDGDTVIIDVKSWPAVFRPMEVRLFGWDAPELKDERPEMAALALTARDRLAALLSTGFSVHPRCRDKFFRLDCDLTVKGVSVVVPMAAEGLLRKYTGEGPKPW